MVPPTGPSYDEEESPVQRRRRLLKARLSEGQQKKTVVVGPRVVQLSWRLPARLRRPVRQELKRERNAQAMNFKRRSIRTRLPAEENRGLEHHTGDMYRGVKPAVRVAMPPYAGSFIKKAQTEKPKFQYTSQAAAPKRQVPEIRPVMVPVRAEVAPRPPAQVKAPKRRFALPLHFSVFPLNLLPKKRTVDETEAMPEEEPVEEARTVDSISYKAAPTSKKKRYIVPLTRAF